MRIHPREFQTVAAEHALLEAMMQIRKTYHLTSGEEHRIVAKVMGDHFQTLAKYWIREERHSEAGGPGGLCDGDNLPVTEWECVDCKAHAPAVQIRTCPACGKDNMVQLIPDSIPAKTACLANCQ